MSVKTFCKLHHSRTSKEPSWEVFEDIFNLLWGPNFHNLPRYPEVIGGIQGSWIDNSENRYEAENLEEIQNAYNKKEISEFSICGGIRTKDHITLIYYPKNKDIIFRMETLNNNILTKSLKTIKEYFPLPIKKYVKNEKKDDCYVNEERIEEIKKIKSKNFDLTLLIEYCEELNHAFCRKDYLATIMLVRSIINHIPPIFKQKKFCQVVSNYGTNSFKESAKNLENSSRKIADMYLHQTIRKKEALPNSNQVRYVQDLDLILQEIVRILKK